MSNITLFTRCAGTALVLACAALWTTTATAQSLWQTTGQNAAVVSQGHSRLSFNAALSDRAPSEDTENTTEVPARLHRQVVDYPTAEAPGTVIIDTPNTYLYFVLGGGKAIRYGIGVGREGFTWSGVETIERKSEWPDWIPPAEMLARQPYLPRFMAGGPGNPLGARAMYLAGTVYRIHGTNAPSTIGKQVSSGCIRMLNEDVEDLYDRTHIGTKVVVLPMLQPRVAQAYPLAAPAVITQTAARRGPSGVY